MNGKRLPTAGVGVAAPLARTRPTAYRSALVPNWLLNYTQDCYLQTLRFFITTAALFVFALVALFSYAVVLNWDASALDLEPEAAANLVIGSAALLALVVTMSGVSREIRLEYVILGAALWFFYNTVTSGSCLCCVGEASSTEHDHGHGGSSSVLDAVNHRLVDKQDACSNSTLIYALHQSFFILLIVVHYAFVIFVEGNYFKVVDAVADVDARRREKRRARAQTSVIAESNDDAAIVEEVNEDASSKPSPVLVFLLILLLGLAAVPLACNSVQRLSFVLLLGKLTIIVALVSLRLINTYLTRYSQIKTANTHLDLYVNNAQDFDTRFRDLHQVTSDQQQEVLNATIKQYLFSNWTVRCLADVVLGCTALILCDWYTFACLAQLLAELAILWTNCTRLGEHMLVICTILGVNTNRTLMT